MTAECERGGGCLDEAADGCPSGCIALFARAAHLNMPGRPLRQTGARGASVRIRSGAPAAQRGIERSIGTFQLIQS
jgi:hypothetical protein